MSRMLVYLITLSIMTGLHATVINLELLPIQIDLHDKAKLQRGARLFMNYCSGCHSLRYMRYNRMAKDLGLTTFDGEIDNNLLINNLIFTTAKVHDPIQISMPESDGRQWFGRMPPDLSLSAREHGENWLYTYLKSFYADSNRPFGANNLLVPDVAMPNVLAPLVGKVIAKHERGTVTPAELVVVEAGEMTEQQFDSALQDVVTFLVYVGEPVKLIRYQMGLMVLLFFGVMIILSYQLKKLYWRGIN